MHHLLIAGFILLLSGAIAGCDGGSSVSTHNGPSATEAKIAGNVTGLSGPVLGARIEVTDSKGFIVTSTVISESNHFNVTVPPGTSFPITLIAHPGADYPTHDPLKAVVTSAIADSQDITPVTTLVVDNAMTLGGLTPENIAKASGGAIGQRQTMGGAGASGGAGAGPGQSGGGVGIGGHANHRSVETPKSKED